MTSEPNENILVYPTPDNIGKIQYSDKAGTCYIYKSEEINCPKKDFKLIPIQE